MLRRNDLAHSQPGSVLTYKELDPVFSLQEGLKMNLTLMNYIFKNKNVVQ